jgi:hypothetical protein
VVNGRLKMTHVDEIMDGLRDNGIAEEAAELALLQEDDVIEDTE